MFWTQAITSAAKVRNLCHTSILDKILSLMKLHHRKISKVSYFCFTVSQDYYLDQSNRPRLNLKGKMMDTKQAVRARSVTFNDDILADETMVDN